MKNLNQLVSITKNQLVNSNKNSIIESKKVFVNSDGTIAESKNSYIEFKQELRKY